jgi:hypothetical protein
MASSVRSALFTTVERELRPRGDVSDVLYKQQQLSGQVTYENIQHALDQA